MPHYYKLRRDITVLRVGIYPCLVELMLRQVKNSCGLLRMLLLKFQVLTTQNELLLLFAKNLLSN